MTLFSRARLQEATETMFADPEAIAGALGDVHVPADIASWLGRLHTLLGVPFGYLVPDEEMLPPESIRFFRLDTAWVEALLDGAFSLGRNLTADDGSGEANLDRVLLGPVRREARAAAPKRHRTGVVEQASTDTEGPPTPWTGFLLRSKVVSDYPGMGVNVYPVDHTPDDPPPPILLPLRRLDRLGPGTDTLFGLVEGEAYQVDVHEAPEVLHYGIDDYKPPIDIGAKPTAKKTIHKFQRQPNGTIKVFKKKTASLAIGPCFRNSSSRVLNLTDSRRPDRGGERRPFDRLGSDGVRDDGGSRNRQLHPEENMRAIVPVNIAALRVSDADQTGVTGKRSVFRGRTVAFDELPYGDDGGQASTGDTIRLSIGERADTPMPRLGEGVHLHWELPDYFKRGRHDPDLGTITFPQAPNRWLVVRTLSIYDESKQEYGKPQFASWVVESDYISPTIPPVESGPPRPAVAVPLTHDETPFMYMGRVVDAAGWDPANEDPKDYLPHYGTKEKPLYLTAIGFVGASFAGYYPDCRSVFGFWDTFADSPVYQPIKDLKAIQFRVSYDVIGWLPEEGDPLGGLGGRVKSQYDDYVDHCKQQQVDVVTTPTQVFQRIAEEQFGWKFSGNAITYTLGPDKKIATVDVPDTTLCAGSIQDIVWNRLQNKDAPFLAPSDGKDSWSDTIDAAVGNTTVEAVSALVRSQLPPPKKEPPLLADYEVLLDALQFGLLRDLEPQGNALVTLERVRHSRAFSKFDGGHVWTIETKAAPGTAGWAELTLPVELAERLSVLNAAQQAYDQGREGLVVMRQQLFMDWFIYVKQLCNSQIPPPKYPVSTNALGAFVVSGSTGAERGAVIAEGNRVGLLHYVTRDDRIVGVTTTNGPNTLAGQVVAAFNLVVGLSDLVHDWELVAGPAAPFWMPTDPVLVMEGKRLEPVRRNGPTSSIAVRADTELVTTLVLASGGGSWTIEATQIPDLPIPPMHLGSAEAAVAALLGESALLDPQWVSEIAALTNGGVSAGAISACQGGQSPLDPPVTKGLFDAVHASGYVATPNPEESVTTPQALSVTFTNSRKIALAPDAVAWSVQQLLTEFSTSRYDPYLPVWLNWKTSLDPLARGTGGTYAPDTLATEFFFDKPDAIDLTYPVPAEFTTGVPVTYEGTVLLSKKPFAALTGQIDRYIVEYPEDAADPELTDARNKLADQKVLSQGLDTFSVSQTLRTTIPQILVEDLVVDPDLVTDRVAEAAVANPKDDWYETGFNSLAPISTGPLAQANFGPLRAGFLEFSSLSIVDVFGQVLDLTTADHVEGGPLKVTASRDLSPAPGDTANEHKAYLPPRLLTPARADAHWLSAAHNDVVSGVTSDFVEMNDHPATSPVCGWVMPNHLDVSLAFYDSNGTPIGSFGVEHDDNVYRTRAGNIFNPHDELAGDIGPVGRPLPGINPHLARVMWFVHDYDRTDPMENPPAGFLKALMSAIERSNMFINPANFAQDVALSVLIGRPLAIARTVHSLSTAGAVLPVSQGDTSKTDALATAVANKWYAYRDRQAGTCAGLDKVSVPVRLGEYVDGDDGLVAFLPESHGSSTYAVVYSSAAPRDGAHGVVRPGPDTVELTANGPAQTFTLFVDPRAAVHVNTGVLPTVALQIPPDQYVRAMQQLAVTFTTRPVLRGRRTLDLPLPVEAGFHWGWIAPGEEPSAFPPASSADVPVFGYSPQRLLEGWLDLTPNIPTPADTE